MSDFDNPGGWDDEVLAALGEVVEVGPLSAQAAALGEAVSRHIAERPASTAGPRSDPAVVATLRATDNERCPLCGRGGD